MKKFLKSCVSLVLMFVVVCSFTACKKKLSDTTVDTTNVKSTNGVSTNGGMTVVCGDYLYFINGTKTNDGTNVKKNTRGAIYRVRYNVETGEVDANTYERLVTSLAGFDKDSLYVFGNFLYYAVPCEDENYKGNVLFNKLTFMRYDLAYGKTYELYTTNQNTSGTISYEYYIVGDSLNLVVYESANTSITSLKIGKDTTVNYVISNVTGCILAENNGLSLTAGQVDANNFVYYTTGHSTGEEIQTGVKVFRTSPVANTSKLLSDDGEDVTLLCIRNGKLVYSVGDKVYAVAINGTESDALSFEFNNALTYSSKENVIFMENEDGSISLLTYNTETFALTITRWTEGGTKLEPHTIAVLSGSNDDKFSLVGIVTLEETVEDTTTPPPSGGGNEPNSQGEGEGEGSGSQEPATPTKIEKAQYVIYINNSIIYKIEIARENDSGEMVLSNYSQPQKLTTTKVEDPAGLLVPEVIGNRLFVLAKDAVSQQVYMHIVDMTLEPEDIEAATMVGVTE